jgi:O-antigen/teichoic acid export membrane protein
MNTVRRVVKNIAVRTGAEILNFTLSTIFLIYVARHLGSADFGKYSFAVSFAGLFVIFTDMGLHTMFIREVAKEKGKAGKLLSNLLIIKSILVLFTFSILFITINLMNYPHETKRLVYIMGIFVISTSLLDLFNSLFRAFERMEYEALIMFLNRLAVVTSGIFALHLNYELVGFAITILTVNFLTIIPCSFLAFRGLSVPRLEIDMDIWRHLFKEAIPIGLMMLFTTIYLKADTVILSILKGDSAAGLYSAPHRLIEALIIFPTFFLAALFPVFTKFHQSSRDSLFKAYEGSFRFLLILALPMAVATTVLSDKFTMIIFGREFINSAIVLSILIWACLFIFLNTLLSYLIIAIGSQKFNIISFGISALTNLILNLILIPSYSYIGAGIALVVSQTILFALNFTFVSSGLSRLPLHRMILKPLFSSLFLGGVIGYIKDANLFLLILASFILYFGILILLRTFSQEDILVVKGLVKLRQI